MDVAACQDYYAEWSVHHQNDVPANIASANRQKRALECMLMRDVIYSEFGIRIEYATALNDFLRYDGPGDGGCDEHIIDDVGQRVILIQSKMSDIAQDGSWTMNYHMDAGELSRIETFVDNILAGTAKAEVSAVQAIAAGSTRETELHDRIDEINTAISKGYDVCLVQLCSGTFAAHWEATQKPAIEAKGWHGRATGSVDIAHCATEALQLDATGGAPDPITLNFITSHSSTDDDDIIHGFITASSLDSAVLQEGWKLTRQNLRHFKGTNATAANSGMVETLNDCPEKFHLFNNGLRITCNAIEKIQDTTEAGAAGGIDVEEWKIENAQIVNGGQTSFSIRRYNGPSNLVDVKIGCVIIKEENEEVLRNIARYSNTQEALDDWDFHADSPELLLLKDNIDLIQFDVLGNQKSFYFDQKSGAFEFLSPAEKQQHRIQRNAGKAIHYRLHPSDFAKASLVMNSEPSVAKSSAKKFHSTSATGRYNDIFVNEPHSPKLVLYTMILLHRCKAQLKTKVDDGDPAFYNQAVAHLSSLFLDFIFKICDEDDDGWNDTIEGYFDAIVWHDGAQGKKINELGCEKFDSWFNSIIAIWGAHMAGTHAVALQTPNSYFNGETSYSHCTTWLDAWMVGNQAAPHPFAGQPLFAGQNMQDAFNAVYI